MSEYLQTFLAALIKNSYLNDLIKLQRYLKKLTGLQIMISAFSDRPHFFFYFRLS